MLACRCASVVPERMKIRRYRLAVPTALPPGQITMALPLLIRRVAAETTSARRCIVGTHSCFIRTDEDSWQASP